MPKNPNPRLKNGHTIIVSCTGGGKSLLMSGLPFWKQKSRVLLFDAGREHTYKAGCKVTTKKSDFVEQVSQQERTGQPHIVAFCPEVPTPDNFDWFCRVVWAAADGHNKMTAAAEELSAVSDRTAKASRYAAILLNQGRKYGVSFVGTVQRPQELPKTIMDACRYRYIGQQKGKAMRKKMAEEIGVTLSDITGLKECEFFRDDGTAKKPEKVTANKK